MPRYRIADVSVDLETADRAFFTRRLQDYTADAVGTAELSIHSMAKEHPELPHGAVLQFKTETNAVYTLPDGRLYRCRFNRNTDHILHAITFTADYSQTEIELCSTYRHPNLSTTDFEYLLTGSVFNDYLIARGGTVLHSSAMAYRGRGVAFSAPSGTGKSTHTELWKQAYGDDVVIINDDKPVIRFDEAGKPLLYGTPWSGKTDINCNESVPLYAIVFLERAEKPSIRRLTGAEAFVRMHHEVQHPYYSNELGVRVLDAMDRLFNAVPLYLLECNISSEAVETVKNELGW